MSRYAASLSSGLIFGLGCCPACQRSNCVCIPIQTSGDVPSHAERRKALCAVIPPSPFNTLESVTRETCNSFAALVTVIPSGNHSRNTSSGCGGLCILLMVRALSVMLCPIPQRIVYACLPAAAGSSKLLQYLSVKAKGHLFLFPAS